jgi:PKD repeat protein
MNTETQIHMTRIRQLAVVAVALLTLVAGASVGVMAAGGTTVSIAPETADLDPGDTVTFDVVVDSADGGVGAAEIGVEVANPSVATITDLTVLGGGSQVIDVAGDGSSAEAEYAFRDTDDTGSVTIIEVTVEAQSGGETDLSIVPSTGNSDVLVFDETGTGYDVTGTNGATITVAGDTPTPTLPTVCPDCSAPTDPDGDGLYEDVNGNGEQDFDDIVVLFENLESAAVTENADAYDFNGNDEIDFDDVVTLYEQLNA